MIKRCAYVLIIAAAFLMSPATVRADESGGSQATVSTIIGTAKIFKIGSKEGRPLKRGDALRSDQEVRVGDKSRVELRFPDGMVMRLAENSTFKLNKLAFDKKTDTKDVKVNLGVGKVWAKVRKFTTPDSSVEIKTSNAVAGVRGTVYRVSVADDQSATVKVYDGSVYVANPPRDAAAQTGKAEQPHEVPGPHAVPPPYHEVSMQEWSAIVQAMQQITISPQGVPSKPENFDPKADADDWVKWNQERDAQMKF
ncbi:MAG TPA: FecR domain-containing protein [Nitrospirota bacterium]|nr:FecR domain-containing protein [Nitrospirota bacterium]